MADRTPVTPVRLGWVGRLGAASARRPWIAMTVWILLLGIALAAALGATGNQTLFQLLVTGAPAAEGESSRATAILEGGDPRDQLSLTVHGVSPTDAQAIRLSTGISSTLAGLPDITVVNPLVVPPLADGSANPAALPLLADDGNGFLLTATISGVDGHAPDKAVLSTVEAALNAGAIQYRAAFPGATAEVGGSPLLVESLTSISESDLARGETVALPIALIVMLVVFGGFIAAGIPLAGAVAAIGGALGVLFCFTFFTDINTSVVNVVTAVGLGLSIDYGLLIVSRFREESRKRRLVSRDERLAAVGLAVNSAGRTVTFSGTVFAIAALGLLLFDPPIVRAIGIGALAVTMIAVASALTLIPALIGLSGERLIRPGVLTRIPGVGPLLSRFGDVAPPEGFFSHLTRRVQRHPALITLATVVVLLVMGSPLLTLQLANTSVDAIPKSSTQYDFVQTVNGFFPQATSPRVLLVTETEADAANWAAQVKSLDRVAAVGVPTASGDAWSVRVAVDQPTDGVRVVHEIRDARPAFPAWVTGIDADTADLAGSLLSGAPRAALLIAVGTMVVLFLMTGSLIIPLKALVASALSLGASIGVLVWGFQQGNFAGLMGFNAADVHGVDALVLLLTFVFGFGLAMDYEMFILSRVTELVEAGVPAKEAIALGLQRSGRIITSAALIIIVVFAGFATGDLMLIKQLGVALAVAVLLDATLVRCLLVPAFMTWSYRFMWWAPRWLKPVHARFALRD
ncbi:MMPL family transporter [Subtercola frigoramans]|uniref:RND superfamily putative drug exporter n=1 Tax=Subtercola frigoramans TaxID=120298 RepID=A0ABS2L2M3_9MICO|nr:MMPL family transporter [Subtercola frigoramans]MBM7471005.1 RND superfamily putative drug exporter [Subtercola frigoramans]